MLGLAWLLANLPLLVVIGDQSRALLRRGNRALHSNSMPRPAIRVGTTTRSDGNWMLGQSMTLTNRVCALLASDSVNYRARSQKFASHKMCIVARPNEKS